MSKTGKQPSQHARETVREAFDAEALAKVCETWDFREYADRVDLAPGRDGRERFYWHADKGSRVLAVGHLDTVQDDRTCRVTDTAAGLLATSGGLDDRLGVYVITELLPRLGMEYDLLLTTDEEIGATTADCFVTTVEYDWIVEFDRGGTDVVAYDFETPELVGKVEDAGARMGVGSYSDICALDFLGCAGLNWGVGYADYHSPRAHAWLEDTFRMVARFQRFHRQQYGRPIPWEPYSYRWEGSDAYDRWAEFDHLAGHMSADCGHVVDMDDESTWRETEAAIVCVWCHEAETWVVEP